MSLSRITTDAFGVVTITLVFLFVILDLICISYSVYFRSCIRKQGLLQLGYFNGPWVTRIVFILVAIWWGIWEIVRLSLLKGSGRLFTSLVWQKDVCKYYILSNIGFAEPNLFLILVFLLRASLQKRDSGTLSQQWNKRTVCCAFLVCLPMFILHLGLILFASKIVVKMRNHGVNVASYFWSTSHLTDDGSICTYPLFSTVLLGFYYIVLMAYVSYFGVRMALLAINKGLRRRVCILIISVIVLLPIRAVLLGLTVLLNPRNLAFEALVFSSFLVLLSCALVGVCMLVYYPIADSMALRGLVHSDIEELPLDDYYCNGASFMDRQKLLENDRNSNSLAKLCSASSGTMMKDESTATIASEDVGVFIPAAIAVVSWPGSTLPLQAYSSPSS